MPRAASTRWRMAGEMASCVHAGGTSARSHVAASTPVAASWRHVPRTQLSTVHGSPSSQPPTHRGAGAGLTVAGGSVVGGVDPGGDPVGSVVVVVPAGAVGGGPDR